MAQSGITLPESDVEALFNKLDTEKTGSINYTEFVASALDKEQTLNDTNLEAAFNFFDKDNNHLISREEMRNAMAKGWISEVQLDQIFKDVDKGEKENVSHLIIYLAFFP